MPPTPSQTDHDTEEAAFVAFACAVLRRAADWAKEQGPSTAYERQFRFVGTSEFYEPVVPIPSYEHWLQDHLDEIADLPEIQICIRRLWASGTIRHLLPKKQRPAPTDQLPDEQVRNLAAGILHAVADMLQRSNSFEPMREHIIATYERFRAAWTTTETRHVAIIPLLNFRAEMTKPLRLSPHYVLSPFTDEEKAWVWA